jgi:predicted RNase H-like HicB family nuclease
MDLTKRQHFMTLAQVQDAVVPQVTGSAADATTLNAALQAATATINGLFPAVPVHYGVWAYQNVQGAWVLQIEAYRGEDNPMNHWDVAVTVTLTVSNGTYTAQMATLSIIEYQQLGSPIGQ